MDITQHKYKILFDCGAINKAFVILGKVEVW